MFATSIIWERGYLTSLLNSKVTTHDGWCFQMTELDVSRKKADMQSLTTRADGARYPLSFYKKILKYLLLVYRF